MGANSDTGQGAPGALRLGSTGFLKWVEKESETSISACYQCWKCTSGCPIAPWMDHFPHQVIRMIELGMEREVLTSRTIWLCADCKTCVTRCPNGVDIPAFMEVLKRRSQKDGLPAGEENAPIFQKAFLDSIEKKGRMHELGMMRQYKMKSGDLFSDLKVGFSMFRKGKLKVFGGKVKGIKEIRKIFKQARKGD